MDAKRFQRIEIRVDEIKDDVSVLKAESAVQRVLLNDIKDDLNAYTVKVSAHVAGDEKIINQLIPLLKTLPEIIEDYQFQKKRKEELSAKLKDYGVKTAIFSGIIGAIYSILKIFGLS